MVAQRYWVRVTNEARLFRRPVGAVRPRLLFTRLSRQAHLAALVGAFEADGAAAVPGLRYVGWPRLVPAGPPRVPVARQVLPERLPVARRRTLCRDGGRRSVIGGPRFGCQGAASGGRPPPALARAGGPPL
eukprot:3282237-Alexandrium_andersonii.AAC.1